MCEISTLQPSRKTELINLGSQIHLVKEADLPLYRSTSLIRNTPLLGPYSRTMPRVLWWSEGGGAVSHERGTPVHLDKSLISGQKQLLARMTI